MDFKLKKSELNFRVYTAPSFPATGTENDICIKSEVPMTNWVMSPDKPSGIPRTGGDVWIQYTVDGDTFNALKNNTMLIATIHAWQYVDGEWADVDAKSHHGGKWVDWVTYLYNLGDQCTDITGGWERKSYSTNAGTVTFEGTSIKMAAESGKGSVVIGVKNFDSKSMIGRKKLCAILSFSHTGVTPEVYIGIASGYSFPNGPIANFIRHAVEYTAFTSQKMSVDISDISSGYPMVTTFGATVTIERIWLE